MLLRSLFRSSASSGALETASNIAAILIPTSTAAQLSSTRSYSAKKGKPEKGSKGSKNKLKDDPKAKGKNFKGKGEEILTSVDESTSDFFEEDARGRRLAEDEKNKSLDVGPGGRPLFTSTGCLSELSEKDVGSYIKFSTEELSSVLPEGLPLGMRKEFEESKRTALLVRKSFLELRDNFRRIVDPPLQSSTEKEPKKQIVLDGPVSCGKSIALAMLVKWAREEGWLVFYVPDAKEWTHGGFFYKNPVTDFWDTPLHAGKILKDFKKYNEPRLLQIQCKISDPIPLGEGPGVEPLKDIDSMDLPAGATLLDLIRLGLTHSHAAVGAVVRLRQELSLITDIPVLIAIDQYNNWFTFSEFKEPVAVRACRQIHARELATVYAFRSMMHSDMMVGAFSHSTAVGKLRKDLPDVPLNSRIQFPRYSLDEAEAVSYYYLRQRLIRREAFSEESWKKVYYLSNGNGREMRWLLPFMRDEQVKT